MTKPHDRQGDESRGSSPSGLDSLLRLLQRAHAPRNRGRCHASRVHSGRCVGTHDQRKPEQHTLAISFLGDATVAPCDRRIRGVRHSRWRAVPSLHDLDARGLCCGDSVAHRRRCRAVLRPIPSQTLLALPGMLWLKGGLSHYLHPPLTHTRRPSRRHLRPHRSLRTEDFELPKQGLDVIDPVLSCEGVMDK